MIDASKFSLPAFKSVNDFPFGLGMGTDITIVLRKFADAIEAGKIAVQTTQTGQVAKPMIGR